MSHYEDDDSVHVVTVSIHAGHGGYFVRIPCGNSGGRREVGPLRLDTAVMVAKEQIDSYVSTHKYLLGEAV